MPIPLEDAAAAVNVRSSRYLIAHTTGPCGHCRASTPLIALALPAGHETVDDMPDDVPALETPHGTWSAAAAGALLFYVEYLPESVQRRLSDLAPFYRSSSTDDTAASYWANRCIHCGAAQDDEELFCEPGGAFLPVTQAAAASIRLQPIEAAIEAAAAGYAYQPQFFEPFSRA